MSRNGKQKLLITAGSTREPIDPVRFISNYSTGTLGYRLATLAQKRGYEVTLISGPTEWDCPKGVKRISVETAMEMHQAVRRAFPKSDALIMSAAVGDFRPIRVANQKIKRSGVSGSLRLWQLELVENPDIVADASSQRKPGQVVIGFALETQQLIPNAKTKLKAKDLDAIVATYCAPKKGKGPFGLRPVDGAIIARRGAPQPFRGISKTALAAKILDTLKTVVAANAKNGR